METALGRIGVLICYDAEFPLLARALVEAGAEILLIPSQTEAADGHSRVWIAAMARALEGQCVTVQAVTQGAALNPVVDTNAGAAGIYAPPDRGFPATGVIARGEMNRPGWTYASVDLNALRWLRAEGNVRTVTDWAETTPGAGQVQTVTLT
jgi:predicted amidohydrolase